MRRVITKCVLDMESNKWIYEESYLYDGPWAECIGAIVGGAASIAGSLLNRHGNQAEKKLQTNQQQFMETLQNEQGTQFANNQEALNTLKTAWEPIAKGGAYQYGFSSAEDQNLISQIESGGATATTNSVAAQQLREQQMSGGADVLPSGAQAAIEAQQREVGAQNTANNLLKEKELGYQTGRENFLNSTKAEEDIAQLSNPTSYAEAANQTAQNELGANKAVQTTNAQSLTSKLLGGVAGGFENLDTKGSSSVGEQVGNFFTGFGKGV